MPLITEGVKNIVGKANLSLFQAHAEDLRLKWIILGEIPKARLQEEVDATRLHLRMRNGEHASALLPVFRSGRGGPI